MQDALDEVVSRVLEAPAGFASFGAAGDTDQIGDHEVSLLPHEGFVFIDKVGPGDVFKLTHMLSYEQHLLPGGHSWELIYDEDGFAAAVDKSDETVEAIMAEDMLRFQVYQAADNSLVLMDGQHPNSNNFVMLKHFMHKYVEYNFSVTVGTTTPTTKEFQVFGLKWPRQPAATIMWSAKSLYECLGLKQFRGQQWSWTHAGYPIWKKFLAKHGLEKHLLRSALMKASRLQLLITHNLCNIYIGQPYQTRQTPSNKFLLAWLPRESQAMDDEEDIPAMLPHVALSCWGLLAMLARWSARGERQGGMREPRDKAACDELLRSLLACVASTGEFSIPVDMTQDCLQSQLCIHRGGHTSNLHKLISIL